MMVEYTPLARIVAEFDPEKDILNGDLSFAPEIGRTIFQRAHYYFMQSPAIALSAQKAKWKKMEDSGLNKVQFEQLQHKLLLYAGRTKDTKLKTLAFELCNLSQ